MPLPPEQLVDVAKTAPPITVTGLTIIGIPVQDWVFLLTVIYTALQIFLALRRYLLERQVTDDTCVKDCANRRKYSGD